MPRGKLALGQNSAEIMSSDKSNSAAMFLRIQTKIYIYAVKHRRADQGCWLRYTTTQTMQQGFSV